MLIIHFFVIRETALLFPIYRLRHRCEIRKKGCHYKVYHTFPLNGNPIDVVFLRFRIFTETSGGHVRPLGLKLACSVFSPEVSVFVGSCIWCIIRFTSITLCPMYLSPLEKYDRSEGLQVLI